MVLTKVYVIDQEILGYFLGSEEELCKEYCKAHGLTYHIEYWKLPN